MTARKQASNIDANGLKVTNLGAPTATSADAARISDVEAGVTAAESRANHTGTQLASTVSDFDTQVRTNRLDQMAAPTASVNFNSRLGINVLDPSGAQDAATKNYVDTQLAGVASGQILKGTVRAVSSANVDIASAPSTVDGLAAIAGDTFLLTAQTTPSQNGPYTWVSLGAAMTRTPNWDTTGEAVVGSYWVVREGTQAEKFALMSNDVFTTLGTTVAAFVYIGVSGGTTLYEADMGNGADVSFTITHSLGTKAVKCVVFRVASPYDEVDVAIEHTSTSVVTVKPDAVWATNEFHIAVGKM